MFLGTILRQKCKWSTVARAERVPKSMQIMLTTGESYLIA